MDVGNLHFSWITLLAAGIGVLAGAAIASFAWSRRARQTRQDFSFSMRKRAAQAEKLRDQFVELQERLRHHDEQAMELGGARKDLAALRVELEHARATLDDAQRALETTRADVADAEARYNSQLESERMDSAERRHHVESELSGARDAMLALQDELTTTRGNAQRTIDRLETDLDATRTMLSQQSETLRSERDAAASLRDELRSQIAQVDWDRQRAEIELQETRREMADKLAATQPYIATMREQYLLAAAERDAMVKELSAQRERMEENARAIEETRAEFALALDEEHRTAMELLNRAWSYVQTFPRIPDTWTRGEHRARSVPDDMPEPAPRAAPERRAPEAETRIEVEPQADRVPYSAGAAASPQASAHSDYDIEAELADAIAEDLDTRSFARNRKPRKPIGTVKLGNETVVVCDDGSTWRKTDRGWRQVTPLPGTPVLGREPRIERAG
ncbi:MAG TPA: hypothetical protein VGO46_01600 [Gemmatimonadaceae bacterium]|nr:hypothetical protein [Gemmatimonadaceae bacterium]